ncbi:hypothetical protein [Streptomyces sp. NPDC050485]|uniref:hypothetical protein n=1 Tax=Streptomyces sp. NPDC050485 TaxID=3365617 RepID=UPI0037B7FADF
MTLDHPVPSLPPGLRARWRDVPRHARLLQHRLSARALTPASPAVEMMLWVTALSCWQGAGLLLSRGTAVLTVLGPRVGWRRRLAGGCAFLAVVASMGLFAGGVVIVISMVVAVFGGPAVLVGYVLLGTICVLLAVEVVRSLPRVPAASAVSRSRRAHERQGGVWWEAGALAAAAEDPVSAGRLVHEALRHADAHSIGLVAAARTPDLASAYQRLGFVPDPDFPPALIRRPSPLIEERPRREPRRG